MTRREQIDALLATGEKTVATIMAAYSLDAVDHAAQLKRTLDYSEGSLHDVEAILGTLHRDLPAPQTRSKSGPSDQQIETIAKMYGGYVGEVMRFEWGEGVWVVPESGPFAHALCLGYAKDALTSPPAKAYKRIVDGPADDIWFYYSVLADGRKSKL
ncbi:hypothetical protein DBR17_04365 [Sphingomonas sp. HMWF008]|nr:hypothetical protein DBR17_04365 [Sphingomonas sp. HMWF008]